MITRLQGQIYARRVLLTILKREVAQAHATALNTWFVYYLVDTETRKVKIGYTNDIQRRYSQIFGMNSGKLIIFHYELCADEQAARNLESELHAQFAEYRDYAPSHYRRYANDREWFAIRGELKTHMQNIYRHKQRMIGYRMMSAK